MAYLMIWLSKKVKKFSVAGYRKYMETDSINFVQSSVKSHPVTLYIFSMVFLKGVFAKNERGYRLNAIKSAFDRY